MTDGRHIGVLVLGVVLTLAACSSEGGTASSTASGAAAAASGPVTIGAFNFTESQLMAQLYAGALGAAGIESSIVQSTNREVLEPALEAGDVQVVPEYLGTFTEFLNLTVNGPDATPVATNDEAATLAAGRALAEPRGVSLLEPSPAQDVNAFAVKRSFAQENGIASLSDLAAWSADNALRLGGPPECPQRPFCQAGLESVYGMKVAEFTALDAGGPLTKAALDQGAIDVGLVFSSDGSVADLDFVVLDDDLGLQNVDNLVPAVMTSVASPDVVAALDGLSALLTTDDLVRMNAAVDIDRGIVADVAAAFLAEKGIS